MAGFNFSAFFGRSSSSGIGNINFADYSAIRNGSYKKLAKAFYAEQNKGVTSKGDKTDQTNKTQKPSKNPTASKTDTSGLTAMKKEADSLKGASQALQKNELWKKNGSQYDMEKISGAVKDFVKEYNNVLGQAEKVSNKDVSAQTDYMKSLTNTMSGVLSKVGITAGKDGKLSLDEEALKKANAKDVKAMFSGSSSYVNQIEQKASGIASAALRNSSLYGSDGTMSGPLASMFEQWG